MEHRGPRVGTGIIAYDDQSRILMSPRLVEYGGGFLSLPGGGVELHETLEASALRELREETNLELVPYTIRRVGIMEEIHPVINQHWITVYLSGMVADPLRLTRMEPEKHGEWRFYDVPFTREIESKIWPTTREFFALREGRGFLASAGYWHGIPASA